MIHEIYVSVTYTSVVFHTEKSQQRTLYIKNRRNSNNPEGLSLFSKLSDVVAKLKISENEFSKYSTEHTIINNEKITNDASVSFYVTANAYKEIPDGWYTKKVFNPDVEVQGYVYAISLFGKGYGKDKDVMDAIEKSFTGYKKDDAQSTDDVMIFINDKQLIKLFNNRGRIIVVITNNQKEVSKK